MSFAIFASLNADRKENPTMTEEAAGRLLIKTKLLASLFNGHAPCCSSRNRGGKEGLALVRRSV